MRALVLSRPALAAAVLASATGCFCSYWRTDACVVLDGTRCATTGTEVSWCAEDPEPPPVPPPRTDPGAGSWCAVGVLHEGHDCADLGFTWGCPDGSRVRPGTSC